MPVGSDSLRFLAEDAPAPRPPQLAVLEAEWSQSASSHSLPESVFAAALQHSTSGIVITDARHSDNAIVWSNPEFSRISGYTLAQCRGRNCRFLQCEQSDATTIVQMRQAVESAQPFSGRVLNRHREGRLWWNEILITPLFDGAGKLQYFLGLQRDISEQVEAETLLRDSEWRNRMLTENASDMIARHAPDGHFIDVSLACREILGLEPHEIIGRSPYEFFHSDDAENIRNAHHRVLDGRRVRSICYRLRRADGETLWVETTARLAGDAHGNAPEIVTVTRDISRRRQEIEEREQLLKSEQSARAHAEAAFLLLQAFQAMTDIALGNLDSDDALSQFMERVCAVLRADTASLLLAGDDGQTLLLRAQHGLSANASVSESANTSTQTSTDDANDETSRAAPLHGFIERIVATREPLLVPDMAQLDAGNLFLERQVRALMGTPLLAENRVIGVLHVGSFTPDYFAEEHLQLLRLVAERAATALERGRLFTQIQSAHAQLHVLSRRLMEAQEAERRHIARELHDEIGQVLTAVKINLQSVESATSSTRCESNSHLVTERVEECIGIVEGAIGQVRKMSSDLRPPVLDMLGLVAALRETADRAAQRAGLEIDFQADALIGRPPAAIETACFRVAQEAITNVVRHAQAGKVEITLRQRVDLLHLLVVDNGRGFNCHEAFERARRGQSLGVLGMEERVVLAGGEFKIQSRVGHGTQLRASFRLNQTPSDIVWSANP